MPLAAPLTAAAIRAIRPPATGRVDYPDGAEPGLALRVPSAGAWKWVLRLRTPRGTQERHTLGEFTDKQGLAWARERARVMRQALRVDGRDIRGERAKLKADTAAQRQRDRLTLAVLVAEWQAKRLRPHGRSDGYVAESARALRHAFAAQWERAAEALDRGAVKRALAALPAGIARGTAAYGRACFGWAIGEELISSANPFVNHGVAAVKARERVLSDDELAAVWRAAGEAGSPFGPIVRMLILTGQRREEVAGVAWSEISPDMQTWTIASGRTKNGVAQVVPLSDMARALLPAERATGLVWPGEGVKNATFVGWSHAKARLDAKLDGVAPWRLHDLRRTLATGLQRLGVRLEVTEAVLNHVSGSRAGIVGIYQRHHWTDEKRAALEAWARHVQRIVDGGEAGNVVRLRLASSAT